jgi:hypothetical protein
MRGRAALGSMPTGRRDLENTADAGISRRRKQAKRGFEGQRKKLKNIFKTFVEITLCYTL